MILSAASDYLTDRDFQLARQLVYRHCGIQLRDEKKELVRFRLAKRIRAARFTSAAAYLEHIQQDPDGEEFARFIDTISTNLTSFFREPAHFEHLRREFVPQLLARKQKAGDRRIRAWSAGCSTGEEAYSLAITLLEAIGPEGDWDVKLLATDISRTALSQSREGAYDAVALAQVPVLLRERYFERFDEQGRAQWRICGRVRQMIRFNRLNLIGDWPFDGPFELIFCRNVMIYFDQPTQQGLVNRFHQCLAAGGMLVTGHAESLAAIGERFRYIPPTMYMK